MNTSLSKFLRFRLVALLCLAVSAGSGLTACSQKLTAANLEQVVVGMKKAEVKPILGEPHRVETGQFTLLEKTTYYYESRGAKVTITFLNDAVVSKEGSFN